MVLVHGCSFPEYVASLEQRVLTRDPQTLCWPPKVWVNMGLCVHLGTVPGSGCEACLWLRDATDNYQPYPPPPSSGNIVELIVPQSGHICLSRCPSSLSSPTAPHSAPPATATWARAAELHASVGLHHHLVGVVRMQISSPTLWIDLEWEWGRCTCLGPPTPILGCWFPCHWKGWGGGQEGKLSHSLCHNLVTVNLGSALPHPCQLLVNGELC